MHLIQRSTIVTASMMFYLNIDQHDMVVYWTWLATKAESHITNYLNNIIEICSL